MKIICMLGPSTDKEAVLRQLMPSGMDAARLSFSRQSHAERKVCSDVVRKSRQELDLLIALLLSTKGPEVRIRALSAPQATLKQDQKFTLTTREADGTDGIVNVIFANLPKDVDHNFHVPINDRLIELRVESCTDTNILCTVLNGGTLFASKGVNVSGVQLSLPFISKRGRSDITLAVQEDFDFIAASLTRSARDILELRSELEKLNCHSIRTIAKTESREGVDNIDEIVHATDDIMIARDDLDAEIPLEETLVVRKHPIKKGYSGGTQATTTTQMLDSMIKNPCPARTEATDTANATYNGTSTIILSGETAVGKYPIKSLETMSTIAKRTRRDINYKSRFAQPVGKESPNVASAISHATCTTAHNLSAVAVITVSKSDRTTWMVSKYRPAYPIIPGATNKTMHCQMDLSWGVIPTMMGGQINTDKLFGHVVKVSRDRGLVKDGSVVAITAGVPVDFPGTTNLLKVQVIGDILASGRGVDQSYARGNLCAYQTEEEAQRRFKSDDVLALPHTTGKLMELVRLSAAITTKQDGLDSHTAIAGMALNRPVVISAESATQLLKSGATVTVNTTCEIVYSGIYEQEK